MALQKVYTVWGDQATNCLVKIHLDTETGELRCRLYVDGLAHEDADYFTNYLDDAKATAEAMYETHVKEMICRSSSSR
jgi:hypothetical protein